MGKPQVSRVDSKAVLKVIKEFEPMLGLHGHIHESTGEKHFGRTLCINPGSEYGEGILKGYIIEVKNGEVRKHWKEDPMEEGGFVNLMEYSGKDDRLKPTDTLVNGESEVLNRIASYVREWSGNWELLWENIKLRAKIKETIVKISEQAGMPELLEADWVVRSNSRFHILQEVIKKEIGFPDPHRVYEEWEKWFKEEVKKVKE